MAASFLASSEVGATWTSRWGLFLVRFPGAGRFGFGLGVRVLSPSGIGRGSSVTALLLLGVDPALLHPSHALVGEGQGIIGEKLHLVGPEEEFEPLGDVAYHLDIGQVPPSHQVVSAQNFQVVVIYHQDDPYPLTSVTGGTQRTLELQFNLLVGPCRRILSQKRSQSRLETSRRNVDHGA